MIERWQEDSLLKRRRVCSDDGIEMVAVSRGFMIAVEYMGFI